MMKVVLFCGGLGTRLRNGSGELPKPMVKIGPHPILWHVMKYYAHFGHNDFILCLGYKGDIIKDYFLNYNKYISNNFTMFNGEKKVILKENDIADWKITFIDTGLISNIGQRLMAVEPYLAGEEMFLANYADGLTNLYLPDLIDYFIENEKIGCFICVKPTQTFHIITMNDENIIKKIRYAKEANIIINGGFFVFRNEIFKYIKNGEELVVEPFQRLIEESQLIGYKFDGFWKCMDTFKEQQELTDIHNEGNALWELWKKSNTVTLKNPVVKNCTK